MDDYVVWVHGGSDIFCFLEPLSNVKRASKIFNGTPLVNDFPADACFHMDKDKPKAIKLGDDVKNASGHHVVSPKLMEFIKSHNPRSVEFLPVTIYNHKGQVASTEYNIMNPLIVLDCIDLEKTEVKWNPVIKERISRWKGGFTLDTNRIDNKIQIFRPKYRSSTILIRRDLATSIEKEDFTQIFFLELDKYRG